MPKTKRVKAKNSLKLRFRDEQGSMPLALVLITFVLIFATIITATLAFQIASNAQSTGDQAATWALDSAQNISAQSIGTASQTLTGLPTSTSAAWLTSKDGTYVYKWWVNGSSPAQISIGGEDDTPYGDVAATAVNNNPHTGSACAVLTSGAVNCWGANATGQLGNGTVNPSTTPVAVTGITNATSVAVGGGVDLLGASNYVVTNANEGYACATLATGTVQCWGANPYGQLGNGTTTNSLTPVTVTGITTAVSVDVGENYACALLSGGTVQCWGQNTSSQLGNGSTTQSTTPVTVSGVTGATQISVGYDHACELSGTTVKCWGDNVYGELAGAGTTTSTTPVTVAGLTATAVATSEGSTCIINASTTKINCWGRGLNGEIGNGASINVPSSNTSVVSNITAPTAITGANYGFCAIVSGKANCWGDDFNGELGDGGGNTNVLSTTTPTSVFSNIPVVVPGLTGVTQIAGGARNFCAIFGSGVTATCWGDNESGQLGGNGSANQATPQQVSGITSATQVAIDSNGYTACAIASSALKCWGFNYYGEVGNGSENWTATPTTITTSGVPTAIAMSDNTTCVIITGGTVQCLGSNLYGQLGNNTSDSSPHTTMTTVSGLTGVTQIAGNNGTFCVVASAGAKCWGQNTAGQIGNGTTGTNALVPTAVTGLTSGVSAITVNGQTSCALTTAGAVKCWGSGTNGQLGNGTTTTAQSTAVAVTGLTSGVAALATGGNSITTCAVLTTHTVDCWGSDTYGIITPGSTSGTLSTTPVAMSGLTGVASISINNYDACATLTAGGEQCWGENQYGQLGNGAQLPSTTPSGIVNVNALTGLVPTTFYAGWYENCYTLSGNLYCWGYDQYGDLGNGISVTSQGQIPANTITPVLSSATLTSQIDIKLVANPGAGIPANTPEYKETVNYIWNTSKLAWTITSINSKQ